MSIAEHLRQLKIIVHECNTSGKILFLDKKIGKIEV